MIEFHVIDDLALDAIGSGWRHEEAIRQLRQSRLSKIMLLIREIGLRRPDHYDAIVRLSAAQDADPQAVQDLLLYPWIGVWASPGLRQSPDWCLA